MQLVSTLTTDRTSRRKVSKDTGYSPALPTRADWHLQNVPPDGAEPAPFLPAHRTSPRETLFWAIDFKRVIIHAVFLPQIHNLNPIMKKYQGNLNSENFTK